MCVCLCVFTTEGVTTTSAESSDEDGKYLGRCVSWIIHNDYDKRVVLLGDMARIKCTLIVSSMIGKNITFASKSL